jgi:hypothetical protein
MEIIWTSSKGFKVYVDTYCYSIEAQSEQQAHELMIEIMRSTGYMPQ